MVEIAIVKPACATIACEQLKAAGIDAVVESANLSSTKDDLRRILVVDSSQAPAAVTILRDVINRMADRRTCVKCGYDLRGIPLRSKCPECGFLEDDAETRPCATCGAPIPVNFDTCWQCGNNRQKPRRTKRFGWKDKRK
jgi:hypothetical protein